MRKFIHVNQHILRSNTKNNSDEPVIGVESWRGKQYGHEIVIRTKDGEEAARFVYRPQNPRSCGARLWCQTDLDVEVITR